MTGFRRLFPVLFIFCLISLSSAFAVEENCIDKVEQLQEKNLKLSKQLREARRQIALEKSASQQPGVPEVLGGIGVIFGLFGVVMMFRSKKT